MEQPPKKHHPGLLVHQILAHSYLVFLAALVLGFAIDVAFKVMNNFPAAPLWGFGLIVLGTVLVYWAQQSSHEHQVDRNTGEGICRDHFCVGPYSITRTPTLYGLFVMSIGLALLYGSSPILITTVVAFLVSRFIFVPMEEKYLEHKYGAPYLEYKKTIKF